MITFTTNMNDVILAVQERLSRIDANRICMTMATEVIGDIRKRIHVEGKAADGSQIGTYSDGYMKVRTGNYGNSGTYSRGAKKGEPKNAGLYTRGKNKGQARMLYNRTNDPKVVVSLTRQMEDSMIVIPLENGAGIGWADSHNYNKSKWVEETYDKEIYALTAQERERVFEVATKEVEKALS